MEARNLPGPNTLRLFRTWRFVIGLKFSFEFRFDRESNRLLAESLNTAMSRERVYIGYNGVLIRF